MKSKKLIGLLTTATIVGSFCIPGLSAFADQFNVISIGANLNAHQKQEMITYFNAKPGTYEEVTINNQEEQKELKGIIPESEIGTRTISCAYVQPTQSGGINVKTANLTYVTASMISNALTTAGIYNANVVAAAPFQVSGTGALTGIMTSFEKATGEKISPEKKSLANKELEVTSKIATDPKTGQTKASAVVNDVKAKVIQNGEKDQSQIASTINNVTNNYGVTLTPAQKQELTSLMQGIASQNYNKSAMEKTLNNIQDQLNKVLQNQGQLKGFMNNFEVHFDNFVSWFKNIFTNETKEAGIVNQTDNNSQIGKQAITTGNTDAVNNVDSKGSVTKEQTQEKTNNSSINVVNSTNTNIKTDNKNQKEENKNTEKTVDNKEANTQSNEANTNTSNKPVDLSCTVQKNVQGSLQNLNGAITNSIISELTASKIITGGTEEIYGSVGKYVDNNITYDAISHLTGATLNSKMNANVEAKIELSNSKTGDLVVKVSNLVNGYTGSQFINISFS